MLAKFRLAINVCKSKFSVVFLTYITAGNKREAFIMRSCVCKIKPEVPCGDGSLRFPHKNILKFRFAIPRKRHIGYVQFPGIERAGILMWIQNQLNGFSAKLFGKRRGQFPSVTNKHRNKSGEIMTWQKLSRNPHITVEYYWLDRSTIERTTKGSCFYF